MAGNNEAAIAQPQEDEFGDSRWMATHEMYVAEAKDKEPDVLFIGDSLIVFLEQSDVFKELFAPLHCLCFGMLGDSTSNILWRITNGELECINPKVYKAYKKISRKDQCFIPVQYGDVITAIFVQLLNKQQVSTGLEACQLFMYMLPKSLRDVVEHLVQFLLAVSQDMQAELCPDMLNMKVAFCNFVMKCPSLDRKHLLQFFEFMVENCEQVFKYPQMVWQQGPDAAARKYLAEMEKEAEEHEEPLLGKRLKEDFLEQSGKLQRKIAPQLATPPSHPGDFWVLRGHRLSPTCLSLSSDGNFAVSASKDGSIIKWVLSSGRKVKVIRGHGKKDHLNSEGHHGEVLAVSISTDNIFLCSGGSDKKICVWDFESFKLLKEFTGHRSAITGLVFREGHHQLYSCSKDKQVKIWNLDDMTYIDTMFGHENEIECVDCLRRERCITCGGRDRTIRMWKVVEESQLVFHAHNTCSAIDCLKLINEEHFVSGADDGSLSVWSLSKKKAVCVQKEAHGSRGVEEFWVSALDTLPYTDLIASGSRDGFLKLWECSPDYKSLTLIHKLPLKGFINGLCFGDGGKKLVCAVGQEHKRGRWWRDREAKNSIIIIPLHYRH